jgi:uncharacterized protein
VTTSNGRPRVWPVFVGFALVVVALQVVGAIVLSAWAYATMPPGTGTNGFVARLESLVASPPGLAAAAAVSATGMGAAALLAAALSPGPWRRRLRLSTSGVTAGRVALVVVGLLAVSHSLDAIVSLLGLSRFGALHQINQVMAHASGGWLAVLVISLALGPGVAEEMFFRGFMQTRLSQRFGPAAAIAVVSACFGLVHFDLLHTPVAAVLGLFLGWATERMGTIVPAMVAHVVNNLVAVLTARLPPLGSPAVQAVVLVACLLVVAGVVLALQRASRATRLDTPTPGIATS